MKWFYLFLFLPILELSVFFELNDVIGTVYTILAIITTAVIGTVLVQRQGKELLVGLKNKINNPILIFSHGFLVLIAGILLLTPGFITDTIGLLLLIPSLRQKTVDLLIKKLTQINQKN